MKWIPPDKEEDRDMWTAVFIAAVRAGKNENEAAVIADAGVLSRTLRFDKKKGTP